MTAQQEAHEVKRRQHYSADVGRYLSALVTQVVEPAEDGADLETRLARLDVPAVFRVAEALQSVCIALGVRP